MNLRAPSGFTTAFAFLLALFSSAAAVVDTNGNQQSDVWEMLTGSKGLPPGQDPDGDGFSNALESIAGTDPRNARSFPTQSLTVGSGGTSSLQWSSLRGKSYRVEFLPALGGMANSWQQLSIQDGNGGLLGFIHNAAPAGRAFFRVRIADKDTDGDGVSDWEELITGFDPHSAATDRYSWMATPPSEESPGTSADRNRVEAALAEPSEVTVVGIDTDIDVGWPDPGALAIRRTGGVGPVTVPVILGGTAVRGVDYDSSIGTTVSIPAGVREVVVEFQPRDTAAMTNARTITLNVSQAAGFSIGATPAGTVNLRPRPANDRPTAKAAARFLVQAGFGPDMAEIERVKSLGFEEWIEEQFARPVGRHQPDMEQIDAEIRAAEPDNPNARAWAGDYAVAWWNQAMKSGPTADPLRQRVAYALSQILVISDRVDAIAFYPVAMANYYDMLLEHSFGNYRDLLYRVTLHPCMGAYLSHLRNAPEDPEKNLFPDENYAREIMQLFSIGLWKLERDGSRTLDTNGRPIPAYTNEDIRNFAKVFTGLTLKKRGGATDPQVRTADWYYWTENETYEGSMEMWDLENWVYREDQPWIDSPEHYHDRSAKKLLNGTVLPPNQRGLKDIADAIDNLHAHPNTGPFVSRLLIQRLVTSNPSRAYVARVASVFDTNKSHPQQMRAVIKAILLDPEARDPTRIALDDAGKQREPYLRIANVMKAFAAAAPNGKFELRYLDYAAGQRPLHSPSVFNFYLPDYQPPGEMAARGLFGPEFQITTDITAISSPNHMLHSLTGWREWSEVGPTDRYHPGDFNLWGSHYEETDPRHGSDLVVPDYSAELALAGDPAALLNRLDLLMTYGNLAPRQHQIIREALERITRETHSPEGYSDDYLRLRVEMAVYLISVSPQFCILK
jgi:uncharacterized protein (DUF1800 family)